MYCNFHAYWWADRYMRWRVIVLVIVFVFAGVLRLTGADLEALLATLAGVGTAAVVVVRALTTPAPAVPGPAPAPGHVIGGLR